MGRIKQFIFIILAFFALLFGAVLYWRNAVFVIDGPDNGFLLTKLESVRYSVYLPAFYLHIATGSLVLITGIFQLSKKIRIRYPSWHRSAGMLYIFVVLALTAPSGLIMAFYANGGIFAKVGFILLALFWWFFTWRGWRSALQRDWTVHREFMMRSYALTFAAVTLRLYSFFFALADLRGELIYNLIVWLSWVPSLLVTELWLKSGIVNRELAPTRNESGS